MSEKTFPQFVATWINNDFRGLLSKHKKTLEDFPAMFANALCHGMYNKTLTKQQAKTFVEEYWEVV